jgi:ferredoxin-NADP reductase
LQTLDSAIARAEEAKAMFDDPADQQIAQCAIDDALYKKQMLLFGIQLIQADIDAMKCAMQLDAAWELILAADSLMRDAVSTVTTGGSTQITRARDLNREALGKLDEARLALQAASDAFPEVDFSRLANYIDAKRASCELAIASDDALLERNYTRASELNNEFRTKDAEVVELARQMPEDPWVLIYDAYEDKTTAWRDEYRKLFDQAADMDAILRAWMTRGVEPDGE